MKYYLIQFRYTDYDLIGPFDTAGTADDFLSWSRTIGLPLNYEVISLNDWYTPPKLISPTVETGADTP